MFDIIKIGIEINMLEVEIMVPNKVRNEVIHL